VAITTDRTRWDTSPPPGPPPNLDRPGRRRGYLIAAIVTVAVVAVVVVAGLTLTSGSNKKVVTSTPPASTPIVSTPQATTPATVPPTSAPQLLSNAAVVSAYKMSQAVFLSIADASPPDPSDPRLLQYMTGAELNHVRNYLTGLRIQGRHAVGTVDLRPVVTSLSATTASITDCLFDHSSVVDSKGQTVSPPDTATRQATIVMVLAGGSWKVSATQQVGTGCVPTA
jgi:hypothetical protein